MNKAARTVGEYLAARPRYTQDVDRLQEYAVMVTDWLATHGVVLRAPGGEAGGRFVAAPVALGPSAIPHEEFERVVGLQADLNQLFDRVSRDHGFLETALEKVGDEFTQRVYSLYQQGRGLGVAKAVVGIHRSDYLVDVSGAGVCAKQVEFNTIASSFASLSALVGGMHRYLLARTQFNGLLEQGTIGVEQLPENESLTSIADGLAAGFKLYGNNDAVIVFVVQPGERNVCDQRWVERGLWERHGVAVERLTLGEIAERCTVAADGRMHVGGREVAMCYFRAGYAPTDFPTEREWEARWMVERSRTIAVPSLAYHLAGCKKIQQELARPGVVERFAESAEAAARIRQCFVGLYPLDASDEGRAAAAMAVENPARFVVKPQREGGGYNSYGADIPQLLRGVSEAERAGYILMDLIQTAAFDNVVLRDGRLAAQRVVSELGVYGVWVSDASGRVVINRPGGHLLRSKAADVNEGGVAAGFAVIDSPLLV
ncbi:Glutathione synthetase [Coemansia sp. Benny D115]|nr:Glutathione synthetase [Coemansia sp. Benny D115]